MKRKEIPALIQTELDALGLPYRIERGSPHTKLFVCDRLAAVWSSNARKDSFAGRGAMNRG